MMRLSDCIRWWIIKFALLLKMRHFCTFGKSTTLWIYKFTKYLQNLHTPRRFFSGVFQGMTTALSFKEAYTAFSLNTFAFLCGMKRTKKSASPKKNCAWRKNGVSCVSWVVCPYLWVACHNRPSRGSSSTRSRSDEPMSRWASPWKKMKICLKILVWLWKYL